jgi:hypothetical protein
LDYRDLVADFKDTAGKDSQIYFDTPYSPTLGPMHEDYEDDAIEPTRQRASACQGDGPGTRGHCRIKARTF